MTKNTNRTSSRIATMAGTTLRSDKASAVEKRLAASALAQSRSDKTTSKQMETQASSVLKSPRASRTARALAGSLVSQSNKKP